jgi:hypothetical protein
MGKTLEIKSGQKIFIATPMYGGMCTGVYTQGVLNLGTLLREHGVESLMSFMFNESLITRARNALTQAFLKSDATHLMFIDADIHFNPHDVLTMLASDKDVIGGIYPKKEINWQTVRNAIANGVEDKDLKYHTGSFVVNLVNYAPSVTVPVDEPVEIQNAGTGFLLIKREVFDKLKPHVPSYTNDVADLGNTIKGAEVIHEYFATSIEEGTNRLLSEDYHFCSIYRKIGGQIYAAPWVVLAHMGTYAFEGRLVAAE